MSTTEKETLAMVAVMEQRAKALLDHCNDMTIRRDSVAGYRALTEDIESFLMFVGIVDDRLVETKATHQKELRLNCSHLRWQTWAAKLRTINRYLTALNDDNRPIALGAKEFFVEEIDYLDSIEEYHRKYAALHGLPSLDQNLVEANRGLLRGLADRSIDLVSFDPAEAAAAARQAAAAERRERDERRRRELADRQQVTTYDHPSAGTVTLPVIMKWGKTFLAPGAQELVTETCRIHRVSTETLARSLGTSTLTLAMILRGQDAIASNALRNLESFVSGNGLAMSGDG